MKYENKDIMETIIYSQNTMYVYCGSPTADRHT